MLKRKVLITGANGQLGLALKKYQRSIAMDIQFLTKEQLDLSEIDKIYQFFTHKRFDFIINCAAYTSVDKAEKESDLAYMVNANAVEALAKISKVNETTLIHISTDYVFDGKNHKPYKETDDANPINIYGKSKLLGEQAIQAIMPPSIIIRTSWLYGLEGSNFLTKMLKLGREKDYLKVVYDQIGTPTLVDDLARTIYHLLEVETTQNKHAEIYHFSSEGVSSWYDFARSIFQLNAITCTIQPVQSYEYPTLAKRPHYSILDKSKLKEDFDVDIPHWRDALSNISPPEGGGNY